MFGPLFALLASTFMVSKDLASKKLSTSLTGLASGLGSFSFALPWYLVLLTGIYIANIPGQFEIGQGFFVYVLLRAISDSIAETCKMSAMRHGDLSIVTTLISSHPIILLLLSPIITGDKLSVSIIGGVILCVIGNLIMLKDWRKSISVKGIGYALMSAVAFAFNSCFDRLSVQSGPPVLSGFLMTLASALILLPIGLMTKGTIKSLGSDYKVSLARGFFECAFMAAKLSALVYMSAPELTSYLRCSLVITVLLGAFVFKETSTSRKLLGAAVSSAGLIWVILSK